MGSKPKEGIKEKLKTLFHISKEDSLSETSGGLGESGGRSTGVHHRSSSVSAFISPYILKTISPESDIGSRLKALAELENLVSTKLLEDGAVENLWLCIQDLVISTDSTQRRIGTEFMIALCTGQASRMGLCRLMFFEHLKSIVSSVDGGGGGENSLILYTRLLKALCRDGQDVSDFEEEIGLLSLTFLYEYLHRGVEATEFLRLLRNLIKYHAAYFDEEIMRDSVRYVCIIACRTKKDGDDTKLLNNDEIISCLNVLDEILCYGCWPGGTLLVVVTALCKLVNVKSLCEHCWTFMRNLLGSHYGHGTIYTMCSLMQAAETYPDEGVLRGSVFFVGAALWSAQQVESLRHTPGSVLSSMLRSLDSNSGIVAYEVALSIQRLVQKYGANLQLLTWDLVLQTLGRIFEVAEANSLLPASNVIKVSHDTLTSIEKLYETHRFNGSMEQLFMLIETVAKHRPEKSILRLMAYRTQSLSPARGNWLSQLHALLDTYYNRESRSNVRIEAVRILRNLFVEHRHLHGDELVEVVVLPVFAEVDRESNYDVQANVINLLVDMAQTSAQNCFFELLATLERTINDRLETVDLIKTNRSNEELKEFFINVGCALDGLIEIVKVKWSCTPSTEALAVLDLLTSHLLLQYSKDICDSLGSSARSAALKFLLSFGAEVGTQRLVYKETKGNLGGQLIASAYIVCADPEHVNSPPHSPVQTNFAGAGGRMTDFSAKDVIKAFAACVQKEREWSVLRLLLTEMPVFLLSRRLALSDVEGVATICLAAIRLCTDPKSVESINQVPDKLTTTDVKEQVYSLLTALIPFRSYFDRNLQKKLASTIQNGITNQKSGFAVISTINCLLEMPDIMAPTIRDLVKRLSELPSAATIAIPVLELLSTLMRMHDLYKDFTADDFENVIQTLTWYVNPFMFTDYIVAMAYQVLFRWFLRAPLATRPRLARFTLKRISSLMKKNSNADENLQNDALLRKAYEDAREVCITFLAYFTFTDDPPSYERSPIAQQLFGKNRSMHWIIGDRIFSISASGNVDGCEHCKRKDSESSQVENLYKDDPKKEFVEKRRRHHTVGAQGRVTQQPHRLAMDDTCINANSVQDPFGITSSSMKKEGFGTNVDECTALCFCWCRDWIELTVRHAIGRQAWVVRISNVRNPRAAAADVDTLAFLACGGADEIELEDDMGTDEEDAAMKNIEHQEDPNLVMNLSSELTSTFCVNDDGADGVMISDTNSMGKSSEERLVLTIPIDDKSGAPERKISSVDVGPATMSQRREGQRRSGTIVNTGFSPDVRSVLLQLFSANIGKDIHREDVNIVSLVNNEAVERAIKNLDRISGYEAHKVGVIYIGLRQTNETEILGNQFGSTRYETFLSGLGKLISLKETDPAKTYTGGLDTNGRDGEFTYHWSDQTSQVIFHIATRMPNRDNDPNFQQKKLHIGNDFVAIVFNESGYDYKLSTISGQFARVAIVVQPLDEKILHIKLMAKNEISSWLTMKEATMSDEQAPLLCRQMAIRADASARIWEQQKNTQGGEPFLSRTAERLRQIKSIKERFGGKPLTVESMFD